MKRITLERSSLLMQIERELTAAGHAGAIPVMRRVARAHVGERYFVTVRDAVFPDELALAIKLLDAGMSRPEAKHALQVRLQIGRTKAYRLLHAALQARQHHVVPATHSAPGGLRELAMALDEDGND